MGNLATERFQTGNHARVFLSGEGAAQILAVGIVSGPLGKGSAYNLGIALGVRPLHVVGDAEPQDLVDGAHTYTLRLDLYKIRDEEARDTINAGYVGIEVLDRFNGKLIAIAPQAKLSDQNINIPANQPVVRNLTFQCMRVTC